MAQRSSYDTIKQFNRVIEKLPGIPLRDTTAGRLQQAIDLLETVSGLMSFMLTSQVARGVASRDFTAAFAAAKDAYNKAEAAFFDSDMLALLYFPEEHKWAVYLPLFLPLWFPLFGNLSSEYKRFGYAHFLSRFKNTRPIQLTRFIGAGKIR